MILSLLKHQTRGVTACLDVATTHRFKEELKTPDFVLVWAYKCRMRGEIIGPSGSPIAKNSGTSGLPCLDGMTHLRPWIRNKLCSEIRAASSFTWASGCRVGRETTMSTTNRACGGKGRATRCGAFWSQECHGKTEGGILGRDSVTPPKSTMEPEKNPWKRRFLLKPMIFRWLC